MKRKTIKILSCMVLGLGAFTASAQSFDLLVNSGRSVLLRADADTSSPGVEGFFFEMGRQTAFTINRNVTTVRNRFSILKASEFSGKATLNGGLEVTNSATLNGSLNVAGMTTLSGGLELASRSTFNADLIANNFIGIGTNRPQERVHVHSGNIRVDSGQYQSWGPVVLRADVDNNGDDRIEFRNSSNEEVVRIQDGNIDLLIRGNHGGGEIRSNGPLKFKPEADDNGTNDVIAFYNGEDQVMVRIQDGVITADQVRLNVTSFPDYVFAKDYDLLPLEEVDMYIQKYKHLPKMPTEAHVVKNGMNVSKINSLLVEKVEELTLYTIKQEKELKRLRVLKNEVQQMKEIIEQLKEKISK